MKPQTLISLFNHHASKALRLAVVVPPLLLPALASAQEYAVDKLIVNNVYTFATPPGAQAAGGYLTITNTGTSDDTLIGGSSSFAKVTQVHEMKMVDDIMKMRHLEKGLAIPAGETVELVPGGFHMMFMQLTQDIKDGETISASLTFSHAGELPVEFKVIDRRKQKDGHDMKHGQKKTTNDATEKHKSHEVTKTDDHSMKHDSTGHNNTAPKE